METQTHITINHVHARTSSMNAITITHTRQLLLSVGHARVSYQNHSTRLGGRATHHFRPIPSKLGAWMPFQGICLWERRKRRERVANCFLWEVQKKIQELYTVRTYLIASPQGPRVVHILVHIAYFPHSRSQRTTETLTTSASTRPPQ